MTPKGLKEWRKRNGFGQKELAKKLGVIPLTVSRWERGDREISPFLNLALGTLEEEGGEKLKMREIILVNREKIIVEKDKQMKLRKDFCEVKIKGEKIIIPNTSIVKIVEKKSKPVKPAKPVKPVKSATPARTKTAKRSGKKTVPTPAKKV